MEFAVDRLTGFIYKFECVRAITVHVPIAIGNTSVREQEHYLMCCLRTQSDEIPEHVWVLHKNSFF